MKLLVQETLTNIIQLQDSLQTVIDCIHASASVCSGMEAGLPGPPGPSAAPAVALDLRSVSGPATTQHPDTEDAYVWVRRERRGETRGKMDHRLCFIVLIYFIHKKAS